MAIAASLREDAPALWAILRMLNLLVDDAAQLGNLGQLFTDPDDTSRGSRARSRHR